MKIYRSLSVLVLGVCALATSIAAQALPSTLHIGSGYNTACFGGSCPVYGSEVNPFTGALSLVQNTGKQETFSSLYLVFGAVNDTLDNQGQGTALNGSMLGSATLWHNGSSSNIGYGPLTFQSLMTSSSNGEAYSTAGLAAPNQSNSFKNWSGAEQAVLGIDAKNFGIYTLALNALSPTTILGPKDIIDLAFNNLPLGTFALGWGAMISGNEQGKTVGTAFTQSGLEMPPSSKVPEPSTLALLCLGFLGLVLMRRRSQQAG